MGQALRFNDARRELWLKLVEAGSTQADANREIGVSQTTVAQWRARGRKESEGPAFEFARRLDAVAPRKPKRAAKDVVSDVAAGRLLGTDDEIEALLERIAVEDHSVPALKLLREIRRERNQEQAETEVEGPADIFDELAPKRAARAA